MSPHTALLHAHEHCAELILQQVLQELKPHVQLQTELILWLHKGHHGNAIVLVLTDV